MLSHDAASGGTLDSLLAAGGLDLPATPSRLQAAYLAAAGCLDLPPAPTRPGFERAYSTLNVSLLLILSAPRPLPLSPRWPRRQPVSFSGAECAAAQSVCDRHSRGDTGSTPDASVNRKQQKPHLAASGRYTQGRNRRFCRHPCFNEASRQLDFLSRVHLTLPAAPRAGSGSGSRSISTSYGGGQG